MAEFMNPYNVGFYQGQSFVGNIPSYQRTFDRNTAMLTYIEEGRANLMRLLLNYAKTNGSYIATDTRTHWGLEHARLPRIPITAVSTSTGTNTHDLLVVSNEEGSRLQPGDLLQLMGFWTRQNEVSGKREFYHNGSASATGEGAKDRDPANGVGMPETVQILAVFGADSASTGNTQIKVRRNFGGDAPTGHAELATAITGVTYAGTVEGPFLWKGLNSIAEGLDDQMIYSDIDTEDYNFCQIVMRKWGATETEMNVDRYFTNEKTFQRNGRRALNEFFQELDVYATLGNRRSETVNGRTKWYAGGILEFIPADHWIGYTDTLFQTKNFNEAIKDMFYFGSQTKIALCGADFYTKFANMIDNKIVLPAATNGWGVEMTMFRASNGGTLMFAPSDTLSLNGLADYCIILDPNHFQYGHLQNMDLKTIMVDTVNPHIMEGEIYGQITFKRTNPDAHWVFVAE